MPPNTTYSGWGGQLHSPVNYYQDETTITEKKCLKLGDDECEIHIRWTKLGT